MRAIMGLVSRQAGAVSFMGRDVSALPPYARARLGIGYCPEERAIFSSLTVRENLALPPGVAPDPISEADLFRLFPNLKNRLHHHGGQLSGGEQQMLAIARILRTGARMLIFDEPTEGLAPVLVAAIERVLRELKSRGYTILLVEQNLDFVLRLADRVVLIERGTVVDEGGGSETSRKRLAEQPRCEHAMIDLVLGSMTIGLVNGASSALLGLGLALIFGLLNVLNMTHGAYMMGAFTAWAATRYLGPAIFSWWRRLASVRSAW